MANAGTQASSRMDTVLKLLLIAFVSLLAFSSGVYFGKQMSDSDHQLKALESDFNTQSQVAANGEEESAVGEEDVEALSNKYLNEEKGTREVASEHAAQPTEHAAPAAHGAAASHGEATEHAAPAAHGATAPAAHVAEESEEHVAVEQGTAEHAAPTATGHSVTSPHSAPAAHAAPTAANEASRGGKPDLSAAHRAAERVANNAAPISNKPETKSVSESRVPSSLPKTVGTNGSVEFTVQVASYPTADAAKSYANDLVKKGFPAFPVEANVNGKTWYRVSVGSFKTMKDATTYRAQLLKQADLQNAIVQKIAR